MNSGTQSQRAVCYARYSSDLQKFSSIERQFQLAEEFCARNNATLVKSFADEAVSSFHGKNFEKELGRCLAFIKEDGQIDLLLVEDMDRLSRETTVFFLARIADFIKSGVKLGFTSSGHVIDPLNGMDLVRLVFEQTRGNSENALKSKRLKESWDRRFSERVPCPKIPFGYMKDPSTGRPVENPETAPIVRRLYAQFAKGDSYHGLARQMNAEKISHPGAYQHKANGKPILGSHWTAQAVKLLLTNPVYATGNQQSKRGQIIGAFSPLVDADTARQCASIQESLKHKPNLRSRMNRGVWSNLFSDILKCAACGSPFLIVQAKNLSYRRYGCKSHRDGVCKNGFTLQVKDAERSILNAVAGVIDEGPIADILRQIDHARRSSKDDLDSRKKKLRLAVKECDKALDALTDRFAATDKRALKPIEAKLIQKQEEKDAIESEIRGIEEKLEILESSKKKILMEFVQDVERLRELVRNAERGLTQELEIDVDKVTDEDFEEQVDGVTKEALEKAHEARKRLRLHLKLVLEELIEVVEIDSRGRAKIMFSNKKTQALDLNCGLSGQSS